MTSQPRAFFAIDQGAATSSAALVGRVAGRWRLLGHTSLAAGADVDILLGVLLERLRQANPALLAELTGDSGTSDGATARRNGAGERLAGPMDLAVDPVQGAVLASDWPRLITRREEAGVVAVLAPTERRRAALERAALGSGWHVEGAALDRGDAVELTTLALRRDVRALLVGTAASPASRERSSLRLLGPIVAAVAARRPNLPIVLSGTAVGIAASVATARAPQSGGTTMIRESGSGADEPIRRALAALHDPDASRLAIARATTSLAAVLDRRIEAIDIGLTGGLRVAAGRWLGQHDRNEPRVAIVAEAGLVGPEPDDVTLDGVLAWFSVAVERPRLRDRLRELWLAPWAEAHGEGAQFRMAVARAALSRLIAATPAFADLASPDLLVIAGGTWSLAPAPAVALAVIDVVRRSGVTQLMHDHARLLGPIGTIPDEAERRAVLADLADDLLLPLGTAIVPQGLRSGRYVGRAMVHRVGAAMVEHELIGGRVVSLEVPPGQAGTAELEFRDAVVLGRRGRRFAVEVAGGMGGVLVDLRDVPLRLPDRLERRREQLSAWQQPLWSPLES